jgi:hypothetical protein
VLGEWFGRKNNESSREVMRCVDHGMFLRQQKSMTNSRAVFINSYVEMVVFIGQRAVQLMIPLPTITIHHVLFYHTKTQSVQFSFLIPLLTC